MLSTDMDESKSKSVQIKDFDEPNAFIRFISMGKINYLNIFDDLLMFADKYLITDLEVISTLKQPGALDMTSLHLPTEKRLTRSKVCFTIK